MHHPFTSLKWIRKQSSLLGLQTVEEAGGAQVHAALMDVYTTHYQSPEPRNHMLPSCSALTAAVKLPQVFSREFYLLSFFLVRVVVGLNVDRPLLFSAGSLFLSLGSPPHSALPLLSAPLFSPPSPAPASNGLNRLASCQSRGLLWLCHKSARKNRNHLFRPGPERGWGCKYMSLALALSPARSHRTTKPSGGSCTPTLPQPAMAPAIKL